VNDKNDLTRKIGGRLKELRKEMKLTLKQLGEMTELSIPLLSKIENGLVAPSIQTLQKISDTVKIDPGYFFRMEEDRRYFITYRGKRKISYSERGAKGKVSYEIENLTEGMENPFMEAVIAAAVAKKSGDLEAIKHGGQELLYVLEGKLELTLGENKFILKKGDSAYFDGDIPHKAISLSKRIPKALNVLLIPGKRERLFGTSD
jgi:transcriptional regulator with XRE-family HTH domain